MQSGSGVPVDRCPAQHGICILRQILSGLGSLLVLLGYGAAGIVAGVALHPARHLLDLADVTAKKRRDD